jgi:O-antigen ligase
MPPPLALTLTIVLVSILLWRDSRKSAHVSGALWLPVIWLFIVGSRFVSQWLNLLGFPIAYASQEDGSPIDATVFLLLILVAIVVLLRRRVTLFHFVRNNVWLSIFLVYCFLAIVWSDFPFVAFKRWIKILGHPLMALIVLSDPLPEEALRTVLKRTAYLLLPLSIVFIKYFPQFGRSFDTWTGAAANNGVMHTKNELGYVCMATGLFFFWNLLSARRVENKGEKYQEIILSIVFLLMIWWLLSVAHSATSLACLVIGAATMAVLGTRLVNKRFIGTYVVIAVLIAGCMEVSFGVYGHLIELLGRDPTLTDRTALWQDALALDNSPVLGTGFESFWLGPRLESMWAKWWWHPLQAHNGYIEIYLNLGGVGVFIVAALLIVSFRKSRLELFRNLEMGRFRLGVLLAIIIYNWTEATFTGISLVWTMFHLIAIDYPAVEPLASENHLAEPRRGTPEVDPGFRMGVRRPPVVARVQRPTSLSRVAASELKRPLPNRRWR